MTDLLVARRTPGCPALAAGYGTHIELPAERSHVLNRHGIGFSRCARCGWPDQQPVLAEIMPNMYLLDMTAPQPRGPDDALEVTVTDARGRLPELIDTQVRDGGVVYLTRYGR